MSKRSVATRLGVVAAAIGAIALVFPAEAGAATPQATVPPVCVQVPLPNPFIPGAQIQVGYCP